MRKIRKAVLDTNIWLDVLLKRPGFHEYSYGAMLACVEEGVEICVVSTSLKDIFYIVSKTAGAAAGYEALELVFSVATVLMVDEAVCKVALAYEAPDYEDGIVVACALADGADAIVTRDAAAFADCGIDRFEPIGLLRRLGYSEAADLQP